jgi:hypothetical protein
MQRASRPAPEEANADFTSAPATRDWRSRAGAGRTTLTKEQQCALHLLDLIYAYGPEPVQPAALASLHNSAARGAEARRLDAIKAKNAAKAESRLKAARRKLIQLIGVRGGPMVPRPTGEQQRTCVTCNREFSDDSSAVRCRFCVNKELRRQARTAVRT